MWRKTEPKILSMEKKWQILYTYLCVEKLLLGISVKSALDCHFIDTWTFCIKEMTAAWLERFLSQLAVFTKKIYPNFFYNYYFGKVKGSNIIYSSSQRVWQGKDFLAWFSYQLLEIFQKWELYWILQESDILDLNRSERAWMISGSSVVVNQKFVVRFVNAKDQ